jgi:hypothetical protein
VVVVDSIRRSCVFIHFLLRLLKRPVCGL